MVYIFSGTIVGAELKSAILNGGTISNSVKIDQVTETVEGTTSSRSYSINLGSVTISLVSSSPTVNLSFIPSKIEFIDLQTEWSESLQSLSLTATQCLGFTASLNLYGGPNFLTSSVFPGLVSWGDFQGGNGTTSTSLVPTASKPVPESGNPVFTIDSINEVPEPVTTALLAGILITLAMARRRQSR